MAGLALTLAIEGCDDNMMGGGNGTFLTIHYDIGEAKDRKAPDDRTVEAGTVITLPGQGDMQNPVGKGFNGWLTGGTTYSENSQYTVNANTIFTAQWSESFITITKNPVSPEPYSVGAAADPLTVEAVLSGSSEVVTLKYQWFLYGPGSYPMIIEGATASSYIPPTSQTGTFLYFVLVSASWERLCGISKSRCCLRGV